MEGGRGVLTCEDHLEEVVGCVDVDAPHVHDGRLMLEEGFLKTQTDDRWMRKESERAWGSSSEWLQKAAPRLPRVGRGM